MGVETSAACARVYSGHLCAGADDACTFVHAFSIILILGLKLYM